MTADQIKAIQERFTKVAPLSEQTMSEFMIGEAYGRNVAAE